MRDDARPTIPASALTDEYGPRDFSNGFDWDEIYRVDTEVDPVRTPERPDRRRAGARFVDARRRWEQLIA